MHAEDEDLLRQMFKGCPPEYEQILRHVMHLGYYEPPDYKMYQRLLRQALTTMNTNEFPYDWEKSRPK